MAGTRRRKVAPVRAGDAFALQITNGYAFGAVLGVVGQVALVRLQAGQQGTMPVALVEQGRKLLGEHAEEVQAA